MNGIIILLIQALGYFVYILDILIFIRCILSWIPNMFTNPLGRLVYRLTEPILAPIRKLLFGSPIGGGMGLDFSPVIAGYALTAI
jgi:YggT family protein